MLILKAADETVYNMMDIASRGALGLLGALDGLIYRIVGLLFELFYSLANAQLLNNEMYEAISNKIYTFIGVIALFTLSFSLLKTLVNPDDVGKTTINSFKTLVTSIILLMLMPTIFQYAFSFQNAIMKDNVIGKIFQINIGQTSGKKSNEDSMREICDFEDGETKTVNIGVEGVTAVANNISVSKKQCEANYVTMAVLEAFITPYDYSVENNSGTPWSEARKYMIYTGNFKYVSTYVDQMLDSTTTEKSITYTFLISTIAGLVLMYIILSFCIDLGVRAAKLAFYQLIAPIPILMRLIPGKEGQFDKWTKAVISAFLEIFVRLIIINFVVFMCSNIFDIIDGSTSFGTVGVIGKAVLAIGLFMFAKQAPKLLSEAIGIEGGNLKFRIRDKLADGGALALGAGVGGSATTLARNTTNAYKNFMAAEGKKAKVAALLSGAGSMTAGALSGFGRGVYGAKDAKTYTDAAKAASKAATDAVNKRVERESYKASHGGTVGGVASGHLTDFVNKFKDAVGIDSLDGLKQAQASIQEVADARKAINDKLNKMLSEQKERKATSSVTVAGMTFNRLADMENELEIMKSTGFTSDGNKVGASDLTDMEVKMNKLKDNLKRDIMAGYNKDGTAVDLAKMDGELKSLITDYRTKATTNISSVRAFAEADAHLTDLNNTIAATSQTLDDFITSGNANTLFSSANDSIKSANNNAKQEINKRVAEKSSSS